MILCYIVYMRLVYTTMHTHAGTHIDTDMHTHMLYPCTHACHIHARTYLDFDGCIYFPFEAKPSKLTNTFNSTLYTYRGLHMHSSISCTPDTPTWQLVIHWLSSWQFGVLLDHYITVLKITRYRIPSELNLSFTRYGDVIHELFYPVK